MLTIFIYPEKSQPAFGLVAIEALLQGTPVIASKAGALEEVVSDKVGILFERDNSESLKNIILEFLESSEKLRSLDTRSYVTQNFSYDKMIDNTTDVYFELDKKV